MKIHDRFTHKHLGECEIDDIRKNGEITVLANALGPGTIYLLCPPLEPTPTDWAIVAQIDVEPKEHGQCENPMCDQQGTYECTAEYLYCSHECQDKHGEHIAHG